MSTPGGVAAGRAFVLIEAVDKTGRVLNKVGAKMNNFSRSMNQIGRNMIMLGGMGSLPFIAGIKSAADFDDELRAVQVALGATEKQIEPLEIKIRELGKATSFTATQVAAAAGELARAGFAQKEIDASLETVLNLARVGRMEMAPAAKIMAQSMRVFGIEANESGRVADAFAIAARNGVTNIEELAQALSFSGGTAAELGLSLEETLATLTAVSANMLTATKGGTSFNQFLLRLATRGEKVKEVLGVDVFDDLGDPRDALAIYTDLVEAMKNMTDQQRIVAGEEIFNVRGARQFLAIGRSAEKVKGVLAEIKEGEGDAARGAAIMDSGIKGSINRILSAFQELRISLGDAFETALKNAEQYIVPFLNKLSLFVQNNQTLFVQIAAGLGAIVTAGAGLVVTGATVGALGTIISGISAVFATLGPILSTVSANFAVFAAIAGSLGLSFSTIGTAIGWFLSRIKEVWGDLKTVFAPLITSVQESLDRLGLLVLIVMGNIQNKFDEVFTKIRPHVTGFFQNIVEGVQAAIPHLENMISNALPILLVLFEKFMDVSAPLVSIFMDFAGVLAGTVIPMLAKVSSILSEIFKATFIFQGRVNELRLSASLGYDVVDEDEVKLTDPVLTAEEEKAAADHDREGKRLARVRELEKEILEIRRQKVEEAKKLQEEEAEAALKRQEDARNQQDALREMAVLQAKIATETDDIEKQKLEERLNRQRQEMQAEAMRRTIQSRRAAREDEEEARKRKERDEKLKTLELRHSIASNLAEQARLRALSPDMPEAIKAAEAAVPAIDDDKMRQLIESRKELARLREMEEAASRSVSGSVGANFQRGSLAAAQQVLRMRADDTRNRLLDQIRRAIEEATLIERRMLHAIEREGGGGI